MEVSLQGIEHAAMVAKHYDLAPCVEQWGRHQHIERGSGSVIRAQIAFPAGWQPKSQFRECGFTLQQRASRG